MLNLIPLTISQLSPHSRPGNVDLDIIVRTACYDEGICAAAVDGMDGFKAGHEFIKGDEGGCGCGKVVVYVGLEELPLGVGAPRVYIPPRCEGD